MVTVPLSISRSTASCISASVSRPRQAIAVALYHSSDARHARRQPGARVDASPRCPLKRQDGLGEVWRHASSSLHPPLHRSADGFEEAAKVDGASAFYIFRRITLPLLVPVLSVAIMLRSLDALKVFERWPDTGIVG